MLGALLGSLVLTSTAQAHGDPASLYLHTRQVYIPTDVPFPAAKKQRLTRLLAAANADGLTIRVAIVADSYELGAVPQLWRRPRVYAGFVGEELKTEAKYRGRVLVVMPNGFGFHWDGHSPLREYALLEQIPIRRGNAGLIDAAIVAVRRLAADAGVKVTIPTGVVTPAEQNRRDRVTIVLAALAALAVLVVLREALRRRGRKTV